MLKLCTMQTSEISSVEVKTIYPPQIDGGEVVRGRQDNLMQLRIADDEQMGGLERESRKFVILDHLGGEHEINLGVVECGTPFGIKQTIWYNGPFNRLEPGIAHETGHSINRRNRINGNSGVGIRGFRNGLYRMDYWLISPGFSRN